MYGGESTRNLEDAVSVVEGFGVRVEGSFLKWTMGNDSSDKIAHIMKSDIWRRSLYICDFN